MLKLFVLGLVVFLASAADHGGKGHKEVGSAEVGGGHTEVETGGAGGCEDKSPDYCRKHISSRKDAKFYCTCDRKDCNNIQKMCCQTCEQYKK